MGADIEASQARARGETPHAVARLWLKNVGSIDDRHRAQQLDEDLAFPDPLQREASSGSHSPLHAEVRSLVTHERWRGRCEGLLAGVFISIFLLQFFQYA